MPKGTRTTRCKHWKFAGEDVWAHQQCILRRNGNNRHGCTLLHLESSVCQHMCASMKATPNPTSELRFVTHDKASSMNTLWQEKGFGQIAAESRWWKKAAEIDKTISVKEHEIERHDFNPTTFYGNCFLESKAGWHWLIDVAFITS